MDEIVGPWIGQGIVRLTATQICPGEIPARSMRLLKVASYEILGLPLGAVNCLLDPSQCSILPQLGPLPYCRREAGQAILI